MGAQKAVGKYAGQIRDSKIKIETNEGAISKRGSKWKLALRGVRNKQQMLVNEAKTAQSKIKADRTREAGAKNAAKVLDRSQEKVAKQIAATNDAIMDAEDELRKTGLPSRADSLNRARDRLKKLFEEKKRAKKVASKEEAKVGQAAQTARLTKMGMSKAGFLEKDLSTELKAREVSEKDITKKKAAIKAGEAKEKKEHKQIQEAMLKRQKEDKAEMAANEKAAEIQQAKAVSLVASLEADLASAKDGFARAETGVRKATTEAAKAEDAQFRKKADLKKARNMLEDTKAKYATAKDEETAAKKAATIAKQKAAQAADSIKPAKNELAIATDSLKTVTESLSAKEKEVSAAKTAVQKGKDALATNRAALKAAWTKEDKVRLTATVQESVKSVAKLENHQDALDQRLQALKAQQQSKKLEVEKAKSGLDQAEKIAHDKKEAALADAAAETKKAKDARLRADATDSVIKLATDNIASLNEANFHAKRRYARDKRNLANQKAQLRKYQNKETALAKKTADAKVSAAKLKAVNAIRMKGEKAKEKANQAKLAEEAASSVAAKEKQAVTSEKVEEEKEQSTEAKIASLKHQLSEAKKNDKKVADAAFAAATQPTTGIARKSATASLKQKKLGETVEAARKSAKEEKLATFKFAQAKKKYRDAVQSKEKATKEYMFRTSERSIKGNSRRMTEFKEQKSNAGDEIRSTKARRDREEVSYEAAEEHFKNTRSALKTTVKKTALLRSKAKRLRLDQKNAMASLENSSDNELIEAKGQLRTVNSRLKANQRKQDAAEKTHDKLKRVLVIARENFRAAKKKKASLNAKIATLMKHKRKMAVKLKIESQYGVKNGKLRDHLKDLRSGVVKAKKEMTKARDVMEEAKEAKDDIDRTRLAESMDYKAAKSDLDATVAAAKRKDDAAVQASKDAEAKRVLRKELNLAEEKLKVEASTVKVQSAEDTYLAKLKKKSAAEAKEKVEEEKAAVKKEEKAASKVEAKEAKVDAKEASKVSANTPASYRAQQKHIQDLVDAVDIDKLVARSKRALAKRILDRQGKPVPKDPDPEPLSDREKKEKEELEEKKLKFMKKEEIRKVAEMKAAQKAAADAKEQGIVKEAETKVANKNAVKKAELDRVANNDKARAARDRAENSLERVEAKWDVTVEKGDPKQVRALAIKLKVAKQRLQNRAANIKTVTREAQDTKTAGADKLVEAKAKAVSDEEQVSAKIKMASQKAADLVQVDVKRAESVANKVEKEKKKITPPSPKKKEDWQKAYENVVQVAKPTASGKKPPGKTRSQERAEKSYAVIQRANVMIEKIKKLNEMSKDNSKAPTVDKGKTNEALNVAKAKELATEAEKHAQVAAVAAKNVAAISGQPPSADTEAALAKAKAEETAAKEKADEALAQAKKAAKAGGKESKAIEKKAEAKAEQAKLKAKADKEAAKAEKSKVEAKKKETQAAVKVAEEKAKAAKGSGDKTAVAAATKKADKAKQKEKLAKIKADAKAVPVTDKTAVAAKVIEKTDINDIPGVSSLHTQSVTEIAKARFAQLIASGDIKVPTKAKSAPIAADKAAKKP